MAESGTQHRGMPMSTSRIEIVESINEFATLLKDIWISAAIQSIESNNFFSAALSGGNTPQVIYKSLAEIIPIEIWNKTRLFQVDERYVSPEHKDSNRKMISETLIKSLPSTKAEFHNIDTDLSIEESAKSYESLIKNKVTCHNKIPSLDLVILGLGTDGHTASLFPESIVLDEKERLVSPVYTSSEMHDRITMTYPLLNKAHNIIYFISGAEKADVLHNLLEKTYFHYPAAEIRPENGSLTFLCDRESASKLYQ